MDDAPGAGQGGPPPGGWTPPPAPGWTPPIGPGWTPPPTLPPGADWRFKDRKIAAGICGILFGAFGVHKFILGYIKEGVIMALFTVGSFFSFFFSMFIPAIVGASDSQGATGASVVAIFVIMGIAWLVIMAMIIIGLIEGILYLTKSDYDFVMTYGVRHKAWF